MAVGPSVRPSEGLFGVKGTFLGWNPGHTTQYWEEHGIIPGIAARQLVSEGFPSSPTGGPVALGLLY